ncbi:MAG: hypothetical protein ABIA78_02025 [archaeon]
MPRKTTLKKVIPKKKTLPPKKPKTTTKTESNTYIQKALIENFVSLQKVMTNVSIKFDNLTTQITKLLELFEISAKTLAEKEFNLQKGKDNEEVIKRIDNLSEQNKIIARSLTLLHEHKTPVPTFTPQRAQLQRPLMKQPTIVQKNQLTTTQQPAKEDGIDMRGYQKSISSPPQEPKFNPMLIKKQNV